MDNIKLLKISILLVYILIAGACAQSSNTSAISTSSSDASVPGTKIWFPELHNSRKKFTAVADMSRKDWNDPLELERVWQNSLLRIPSEDGEYASLQVSDMAKIRFSDQKKHPTVVYMHGCSGIWPGTIRRINFLAENGFAVVAPPSFAREKYPKSCDVDLHQGGLYRDTIKIRQNDARHAIEKAKQLPWVDKYNVFLMGLSEGGITTATFNSKQDAHSVNARVIEGWTCTSTWREYNGLRAPKTQPVLSLLGSKDPWFQNPYNNGECASFMNKKNGSKSVVYKKGALSYKHELLEDTGAQNTVLQFLQQHIR